MLTHLALVAGAGGVQQLGISDVRSHAGRGGQETPKGRRFKSISRSTARPTRGTGTQQSPVPGSRARLWVTGTGLHRSRPALGSRALGGLGQPGGLGQGRQRWVGTGEGACFSSLSKCGLAAVGPAGRQHMIPAAWG